MGTIQGGKVLFYYHKYEHVGLLGFCQAQIELFNNEDTMRCETRDSAKEGTTFSQLSKVEDLRSSEPSSTTWTSKNHFKVQSHHELLREFLNRNQVDCNWGGTGSASAGWWRKMYSLIWKEMEHLAHIHLHTHLSSKSCKKPMNRAQEETTEERTQESGRSWKRSTVFPFLWSTGLLSGPEGREPLSILVRKVFRIRRPKSVSSLTFFNLP